jgi:hypothetical protein
MVICYNDCRIRLQETNGNFPTAALAEQENYLPTADNTRGAQVCLPMFTRRDRISFIYRERIQQTGKRIV